MFVTNDFKSLILMRIILQRNKYPNILAGEIFPFLLDYLIGFFRFRARTFVKIVVFTPKLSSVVCFLSSNVYACIGRSTFTTIIWDTRLNTLNSNTIWSKCNKIIVVSMHSDSAPSRKSSQWPLRCGQLWSKLWAFNHNCF